MCLQGSALRYSTSASRSDRVSPATERCASIKLVLVIPYKCKPYRLSRRQAFACRYRRGPCQPVFCGLRWTEMDRGRSSHYKPLFLEQNRVYLTLKCLLCPLQPCSPAQGATAVEVPEIQQHLTVHLCEDERNPPSKLNTLCWHLTPTSRIAWRYFTHCKVGEVILWVNGPCLDCRIWCQLSADSCQRAPAILHCTCRNSLLMVLATTELGSEAGALTGALPIIVSPKPAAPKRFVRQQVGISQCAVCALSSQTSLFAGLGRSCACRCLMRYCIMTHLTLLLPSFPPITALRCAEACCLSLCQSHSCLVSCGQTCCRYTRQSGGFSSSSPGS